MRILSIDVGMKHLAFCVFVIQNTERFIVEKWDIVNLCTNNQTNKKCMGTTKKDKICDRIPKFYKNNEFYCKIHAKNKDFKIPPKTLYKSIPILNRITLTTLYTSLKKDGEAETRLRYGEMMADIENIVSGKHEVRESEDYLKIFDIIQQQMGSPDPSAFQTRAVLSQEAVTMRWPSGLHAP